MHEVPWIPCNLHCLVVCSNSAAHPNCLVFRFGRELVSNTIISETPWHTQEAFIGQLEEPGRAWQRGDPFELREAALHSDDEGDGRFAGPLRHERGAIRPLCLDPSRVSTRLAPCSLTGPPRALGVIYLFIFKQPARVNIIVTAPLCQMFCKSDKELVAANEKLLH